METVRRENYLKQLEQVREIEVRRGHGRFLSPRQLQVGAEVLAADRFLIACGGVPRFLPLPGLEEVDYLTSYSALHLDCFPRSLVIVGGGVIGLESGAGIGAGGVAGWKQGSRKASGQEHGCRHEIRRGFARANVAVQ